MTLAGQSRRDVCGVLRRASLSASDRERGAAAVWPAPATDPRLMIAVVLIFGELMIVTAVALFFSTFTGPMTAIMLTLALWIAGHFNADLRHFEEVVDAPVAVYHRACSLLRRCPTWLPST